MSFLWLALSFKWIFCYIPDLTFKPRTSYSKTLRYMIFGSRKNLSSSNTQQLIIKRLHSFEISWYIIHYIYINPYVPKNIGFCKTRVAQGSAQSRVSWGLTVLRKTACCWKGMTRSQRHVSDPKVGIASCKKVNKGSFISEGIFTLVKSSKKYSKSLTSIFSV